MAFSNLDVIKHRNKRLVIEPFNPNNVTPTGYDLALGYAVLLAANAEGLFEEIDFHQYSAAKKTGAATPFLTVPGKTDVLILTKERVHLSGKILAQVHARSGITAKGFLLNPLTVDPNFGFVHGRLTLRFYNFTETPANLSMDETVATLVFHAVETETKDVPRASSQEATLTKYDHIPHVMSKVSSYLQRYGSEEDEGEISFRSAIEKLNEFRKRSWVTRKLIQTKDSWQWRGTVPFVPLILFDLGTLAIRSFPALLNTSGMDAEALATPAFWISVIAANLAYVAFVKSVGK